MMTLASSWLVSILMVLQIHITRVKANGPGLIEYGKNYTSRSVLSHVAMSLKSSRLRAHPLSRLRTMKQNTISFQRHLNVSSKT